MCGNLVKPFRQNGVLDDGIKQGLDDFHKLLPAAGPAHRYVFKVYALNRITGLQPGATKQQLLRAIKGHTLAEAQLTGTYKR
jgi:phosphatidylethanolamine-binding protein (PEBP) family uncharacterized protein